MIIVMESSWRRFLLVMPCTLHKKHAFFSPPSLLLNPVLHSLCFPWWSSLIYRPTSSLPAWDGQNILPRNHANFPSSQGRPFVASIVSSYDTESRYQSKLDDAQVQKRTRSIPLSTTNETPFENCHFPRNNFKRSAP